MRIPIRNIYYLMCYAWDALPPRGVIEVGKSEAGAVQDLLASVLARGVEHIMRRGLARDYLEYREDSSWIRGRIDWPDTTKRALQRRSEASVVYEELTADIPANQVLRGTMGALLDTRDLSSQPRQELAAAYKAMRGVSEIRVTPSVFRRVRLHRGNQYYRFLLATCEMVHDNLLPVENAEGSRFADFARDEEALRRLFERFVLNFYRREQDALKVSAETFGWYGAEKLHMDGAGLPGMRTDVVLTGPSKKVVIDTKFTPRPFQHYYGHRTLRSEHLYQMFAYLQNISAQLKGTRAVSGLLLYPGTGQEIRLGWAMHGVKVKAASVDLGQEWAGIRQELLSLVDFAQS